MSSFGVLETFRDLQIDAIAKDIPIYETGKWFFTRHVRVARRLLRLLFRLKPGNLYFDNQVDESVFSKTNWKLLYFDGYWQDKFFPQWVDENVQGLYEPISNIPEVIKPYIEYINSGHVTSVHVRRGDYLNASNINTFGVCSLDYFEQAAKEVCSKDSDTKFLVFTDDIPWVKENLKFPHEFVVVNNDPIKPFWYIYLMSLCSNNIMSNSSFSWWGAFLNKNKQKIVVAPKKWYKDSSNPKMYLDSYIVL